MDTRITLHYDIESNRTLITMWEEGKGPLTREASEELVKAFFGLKAMIVEAE